MDGPIRNTNFRLFLRHDEVGALFSGEIRAVERGDDGVMARGRRRPGLACVHRVAAAQLLVLDALREHSAGRPPPHLASDGVDDDEVVRLSAAESELDVFLADILDAEGELNGGWFDGDVEV